MDGESDVSGSFKISDGSEDIKKGGKVSFYNEKIDLEEQVCIINCNSSAYMVDCHLKCHDTETIYTVCCFIFTNFCFVLF